MTYYIQTFLKARIMQNINASFIKYDSFVSFSNLTSWPWPFNKLNEIWSDLFGKTISNRRNKFDLGLRDKDEPSSCNYFYRRFCLLFFANSEYVWPCSSLDLWFNGLKRLSIIKESILSTLDVKKAECNGNFWRLFLILSHNMYFDLWTPVTLTFDLDETFCAVNPKGIVHRLHTPSLKALSTL